MTSKRTSDNSIDDGVAAALRNAQTSARQRCDQYAESVRESPCSALACAVAAGYFMRLLPLTAIFAGLVRIVGTLAKPALLLFGAAKLYEAFQEEDPARRRKFSETR
jgi:hypothetical protein